MSERKVLNKYFPPDFDPSKIPKRVKKKNEQHKVRLMAPFSMHCVTCGNWIAKSTKFNARKETVEGEMYLTIKIYRFYIRCPRCSAEITFKTDPKNADYVCEHGALRNFDSSREERILGEEMKLERQQQEENNPMKALENRTLESKKEMDILDALDEIRTKNARTERLNIDEVNEKILKRQQKTEEELLRMEEEEIDKIAKATFKNEDGDTVKRLSDDMNIKSLLNQKYHITPSSSSSLSSSLFSNNSKNTATTNNNNKNNNINNNNNNTKNEISNMIKKRRPENDLLSNVIKKKSKPTSTTSTNTNNTKSTIPLIKKNNTPNGIVKKNTTTTTTITTSTSAPAPAQNSLTSLFAAYDSDSDSD
ncbi:DUF572-domain-containing protein [Anaeromyces robustus]|uniref:Splicing factor YJU2 n=1 Tax=Anaeromyces robustus TaxID=1754192 RepID=A0A1Y1X844_9FUNG|nr:DUF572-domain-containing protein [Anaeromyces robustus]|eukprot:ORX81905.1 DUF572-domain-containing protein [Anaeromyces robustus]